jgi:uncharacterized repeat protein (TIGR04138 family)
MPKKEFPEVVMEICETDIRYSPETYSFVREGLDHTLKLLKRQNHNGTKSHVTGQELLNGLREYALAEFGPMSKTVLNDWGVKSCEDFGEVVFNLVNAGVLGKTDSDSLGDFKGGFSFDEAFVKPFRPRANERSDSKDVSPTPARRPRKSGLHPKTKTPKPAS